MQFSYIGTNDAADPEGTHAFGLWFPIGEPIEVSDERVVLKLIGHPHFEPVEDEAGEDDEPAQAPRRRGRPAKVKPDAKIAD